ncbi:biotin/lipoyl-binding protein [Brevibacillus ginsengisoli]|uniref:biotin/lipoyl-containing protein n=1 Tax=Brevibacillus ginsengisoli TaxID=363854 RepID=UPI003CEC401F
MLKFDVITPFAGTVEQIFFRQGERVEEGDKLFTIKGKDNVYDIQSPITGFTDQIEVSHGDQVICGTILAQIKEAAITQKANRKDP